MIVKHSLYLALFLLIGSVLPTCSYAQDLIEQDFYENGKLKTSAFREGNQFFLISFYENGKLKEKAIYTDNQKNGKFQSWFENGQPHIMIEYVQNVPSGKWMVWNEAGIVIGVADYRQGDLVSGSMWDDYGNLIAQR
jgi:antitoxin component YwqK of YwqJK toxin-antitoxin module